MLGAVVQAMQQAAQGAAASGIHASADSVRMDQSPLPGGVANVFRFLFSGVPQWIQIGGVLLGAIVGVTVLVTAWQHREPIAHWLATRSRGYKMALGAGVGTTLLTAGLAGGWTYNYMMHENAFCSSCHVMKSAFGKFQTSEHSKLQCHSCHQQSIFASSKELYYWVMDRPEKIPAHSKVPNRICAECHITQKRDSVWQFISATAGHQVHMKSDSAALRDVMCVSCHAKEVHAFAPTDLSCKQSGCHDKVTVKLGKMADQTSLHCATCHEFTRPVNDLAPLDSGRVGLVPLKPQCFTCHEMREKMEKAGLDRDPHKAKCGTCHNPHVQEKAVGALKSCATSECHANADTLTAFHRGLGKHAVDDCVACHQAHTWKVASTDCLTCHKTIFQDRPPTRGLLRKAALPSSPRSAPSSPPSPLPGGTASSSLPPLPHAEPPAARRGGPSADGDETSERPWWSESAQQATAIVQQGGGAARSKGAPFQHSRHRSLACVTCHKSDKEHGSLVVRDAASCQGCHHGKEQKTACTTCHATGELATSKAVSVSVHVSSRANDVNRTLTFEHGRHSGQACTACHADTPQRALIKSCTGCHTDHHGVQRSCTSCHPTPRAEHPRTTHDGCAACHKDVTVASLPPVRTLCVTCHPEQRQHYAPKECVTCHRVSWNELKGQEGAR